MAWQSGGGSGYPGVTSDGALGLLIAHAIQAGDGSAAVTPDFHGFFGATEFDDVPANLADGDIVVRIAQFHNIPAGQAGRAALRVERSGSTALQDYSQPAQEIIDTSGSAQPAFRVTKGGNVVLEVTARQSITGALSTVSDAPAKAVLTSIIAALTGIKVATNSTT